MGCLCYKEKGSTELLEKNVIELNKISNSEYFGKKTKIKMHFNLLSRKLLKLEIVKKFKYNISKIL